MEEVGDTFIIFSMFLVKMGRIDKYLGYEVNNVR